MYNKYTYIFIFYARSERKSYRYEKSLTKYMIGTFKLRVAYKKNEGLFLKRVQGEPYAVCIFTVYDETSGYAPSI